MSRDYKLNKSELLRLRREEKLYSQYLPVLRLKMEALEAEKNRLNQRLALVIAQHQQAYCAVKPYIKCFGETMKCSIADVIVVEEIKIEITSVAGVSFTTLSSLRFKAIKVPYFLTAPWLIRAIPLVKNYLYHEILKSLTEDACRLVMRELKKTVQRVNLFDMVLIPDAKDAIRHIKIALENEEMASISRGKCAKSLHLAKQHDALSF